jgi:hypothetical protein
MRAALRMCHHSRAVTELKQFEGRGHSPTVDGRRRDVAQAVLARRKVQGR